MKPVANSRRRRVRPRYHLDLFAGVGGFSRGLDEAGYFAHDFVEIEPHLQRVLRRHWPHGRIFGDVMPYHAARGEYFIVTGGFPCQDISRANKDPSKGGINGPRSGLWKQYLRVLAECRPKYCIIENVYDLLSNGLDVVTCDLAQIGYDATYAVLDSQFFGIPQRRRRVYVVGVRDGIPSGADPLQLGERSGPVAVERSRRYSTRRPWTSQEARGSGKPVAYFARSRSDKFVAAGVASTITKRDYKSVTDVVLHEDGAVRGLSVGERMRLQGLPEDWVEGCGLTLPQKYQANGMSVPVVKWVAERILEFDRSLS